MLGPLYPFFLLHYHTQKLLQVVTTFTGTFHYPLQAHNISERIYSADEWTLFRPEAYT